METLLKQQTALAGYITRMWTNTQKLGQARVTIQELSSRLIRLDDYWARFQDQHFEILAHEDSAKSEYVSKDIFSSTEDSYFQVRSQFLTVLDQFKATEAERSTQDPSSTPSTLVKQMQLPKINLPKFSGDQLAWESFRDLFRSLVHDVKEIPRVQKLQYLKSSLSGEALEIIANVSLTDTAYEGAWKDLLKRYDNQRILLFSHMRNILTCPSATKASPSEIKRLLGVFTHSRRAFEALSRPVDQWDDWFVHLIIIKLDSTTRLAWETSLADSSAFPKFAQVQDFLENRMRALEAAKPDVSPSPAAAANTKGQKTSRVSVNTAIATKTKLPCPLCQQSHAMQYCAKFKPMTVVQRHDQVRKASLCFNCLRSGHSADACPSSGRCLVCGDKHHTMLHGSSKASSRAAGEEGRSVVAPVATNALNSSVSSMVGGISHPVLLSTARIILESDSGHSVAVRALLDQGSEASFVTEWVAQRLAVKRNSVNISVVGLQGIKTGEASSSTVLTLRSPTSPTFHLKFEALVFRTLTGFLPAQRVSIADWPHLKGLQLADPNFDIPARVDAVLGADVYAQLLESAVCRGPAGSPTAQRTALGWILVGSINETHLPQATLAHHVTVLRSQPLDDLSEQLQRFWEIEEVGEKRLPTTEEEHAEAHFRETHSRDATGRYVVRLPRRQDSLQGLGNSRTAALSMLLSSERRLHKQTELRTRYTAFMTEYLSLGHMEPITSEMPVPPYSYYLPHHAVFKSGDVTGKIRVVFNASFRTTSGLSLNDCLLPGPKLQPDLWVILSRWRFFRVGFMTDIVKMFRQIQIHQDDADLQRVLWRADSSGEVQDFRLLTVTYGTASAPFLALRTLRQLAQDEATRFPLGAETLLNHSYVDDILAGSDDLDHAREVRDQLVALLGAGGFALSKWASNDQQLCPQPEERQLPVIDAVTALGVIWNPHSDTLALKVTITTPSGPFTKRRVLADVARLFDPLGWVSPVLVYAKIFVQDLWLAGCSWDEHLPKELTTKWSGFRSSLHELEAIRLPRWLHVNTDVQCLELHGFSDASERAYAAVVYVRVTDVSGQTWANLLTARTKVAPVKTLSVPRLELCGAVLLARLLNDVTSNLGLASNSRYAWTDAQVVLCWLRSHASRWKPFVANRVAEVQRLLPSEHWNYVRTSSNPADLATRGISPKELQCSTLWWSGPDWLTADRDDWPVQEIADSIETPEDERRSHHQAVLNSSEDDILERFSTLSRLVRVSAFCFRFLYNSRQEGPRRSGSITSTEREDALRNWIRLIQHRSFPTEVDALSSGRSIATSSRLRTLSPFLDDSGLLRVGGRIQSANLAYSERHPLVLPKAGHFTLLVVRDAHLLMLHGGPQLTRSYLLRRYWILDGASLIRRVVRACVRCTRFRGEIGQQQMGQLPPERLRPGRPFVSSGLDYAGPFRIRAHRGRGHAASKGYICLFVCLATKAIHLEVASDLSTPAFLAAFRRFVARRGRCQLLLSDNATNFRGADAELRKSFRAASNLYKEASASLAEDGTEWRFIPPRAPHFGGLWEAGVRSTKHHLRRVVGDHALTYEELATLLCQIEACLNSRPLYPLSSDPTDLVALTPGHFLLGETPTNVPEPPTREDDLHPVTRWRLISAIRDSFWRRWSKEYLHHLQQRSKWPKQTTNLEPGTLVLVRDEALPPAKWALGRITQVFPGPDGLVRVASVRTASTEFTRPIVKLCPLPIPPTVDPSIK